MALLILVLLRSIIAIASVRFTITVARRNGIVFPFINGKPLKFYGIDGPIQIFVNDETGEVYHCKVTDKTDLDNIKYELYKQNNL